MENNNELYRKVEGHNLSALIQKTCFTECLNVETKDLNAKETTCFNDCERTYTNLNDYYVKLDLEFK